MASIWICHCNASYLASHQLFCSFILIWQNEFYLQLNFSRYNLSVGSEARSLRCYPRGRWLPAIRARITSRNRSARSIHNCPPDVNLLDVTKVSLSFSISLSLETIQTLSKIPTSTVKNVNLSYPFWLWHKVIKRNCIHPPIFWRTLLYFLLLDFLNWLHWDRFVLIASRDWPPNSFTHQTSQSEDALSSLGLCVIKFEHLSFPSVGNSHDSSADGHDILLARLQSFNRWLIWYSAIHRPHSLDR